MSDRYNPTPVGFARVNREPLDKYETFNDIEDALEYVELGSAYQGQKIRVNFDEKTCMEFLVKNNKLFPILSDELNVITRDGRKYVLVYYNNTSNVYTLPKEHLVSLGDAFKFSIMGAVPVFRTAQNNYGMMIIYNGAYHRWTQNTNPNIAATTISSSQIEGSYNSMKYVNNSNGYLYCSGVIIAPKVKNTNRVAVYIDATDYLTEVGYNV